MADERASQVPEGAAVFPVIPPEVDVHPLLLAVIHATVFLAGSDDDIVQPDAADEAVQHIAGYLGRLKGAQLDRVREDFACLAAYARQQQWPQQLQSFVSGFLEDYGIGEGDTNDG
jgi:hypothetical protein